MIRKEEIIRELRESAEIKLLMLDRVEDILAISKLLITCFQSGGKVVLLGNGGSAADAQHIAGELVGKYRFNRPPLPVLSLTTNTSILTAIANDDDFTHVFSRQVEAWVQSGDVVIGISTSGRSNNVIEALRAAKLKGGTTIGLCGNFTDQISEVADICLSVPSDITPRVQEVHITIGHILSGIVEQALFGGDKGSP
jgi:D-sedoheptulose 7-phosphate isomerase